MKTHNSRARLRGRLTFSKTEEKLNPISVCGLRRTPLPKHRTFPLVLTRLGARPMNDIDVDVYNARKDFISGSSKSFNNLNDFFKDLDE
ncbi:MAG: hypothetical protein VR72_11705 [Clostridiaceae bacterium BRH_c20a]|nr:MAG: hypothetical protein VR72_11705 [Clostridiaceae bacterium BRH_c20a]